MSVLVVSGRTSIAVALGARPLYLAWGSGDPAWDSSPIGENVNATALLAEIGRRRADVVAFAVADVNGDVVVPQGRFSTTSTPSNSLYLRFNFDYLDAATAQIRELGVFMDTVLKDGLPPGQTYFQPTDIADPGRMIALQYEPVIIRSAQVKPLFEFVWTF